MDHDSDELERLRSRIAELERVEELLRESEATIRSMAEASPDHVMLLDREGRILFINRTVPDLTVDEVLGRPVFDFIPPSQHADTRACFDRVIATGRPDTYETEYPTPGGGVSIFESRVGAVLREDEVVAMAVHSTDVTEHRRRVRDLREREAERDRFFALSIDMLCIVGTDGYFRRVSRAFTEVLGYSERELLAQPMGDFIHPDDRERSGAMTDLPRRGEQVIDFENRYRTKAGDWRLLQWRASGVSQTDTIYAIARDITVRRAADDQLHHSQKMEAVGQLAGGVAHDFNNVVLTILANAEFAAETVPADHAAHEHLAEVRSSAQRAARLTRQLLAFSRRDAARREPLDLRDVVVHLMRMVSRLLPETIEVEVVSAEEPVVALADAGQLEQVVVNLCVNARDAMPDGGKLTVTTQTVQVQGDHARSHPWAPPGRHALMTVSDTGHGMSAEVRARIFEPFFTTKQPGRGTGLGLPTVYAIVRQHGGLIHADSTPGVGTTFEVYLPAAEGRATGVEPRRDAPVRGGHERLLVAEDEPAVRTVVARILEHAGYEVVVASDGREALALFEAGPTFDLVILDMVMPQMGGHEVWERMSAVRPDVRVLVSSGYSEHVLPQGGPELLPKPYVADELLRRVREVLDRS